MAVGRPRCSWTNVDRLLARTEQRLHDARLNRVDLPVAVHVVGAKILIIV